MEKVLVENRIKSFELRDYEKLRKIGFINKDIKEFEQLVGSGIRSVVSRGNVIHISLDNGMNLVIGPEYGGKVLYHTGSVRDKFHLKLDFIDGSALTVRLTSMGIVQALTDDELKGSYVYRRDFSDKLSPLEENFSLERFADLITVENRSLKSLLVGKDAVIVGLSNSAFQDIIYRSKLHPKKKGLNVTETEIKNLYDAVKSLVENRLRLGGKNQFIDLHGKQGDYNPVMGPNMKGKNCIRCGTPIEKMSVGGGQVYMCPECQR